MSNWLSVQADFDRDLVSDYGGSVRYLMINMKARDILEQSGFHGDTECDIDMQAGHPLNLVLVIDASSSMTGKYLEKAKAAASQIVKGLCKRDFISIVSFSDRANVHVDGVSCDDRGRRNALRAIEALTPELNTNLSEGWMTGARCAAKVMAKHPESTSHVLILTDGYANRGVLNKKTLADHARNMQERGLTTSTIGIGSDYSVEQIHAIAINGGGMVHHAPESEELVAIVSGELNSLRNRVVENIEIEIEFPDFVQIEVLSILRSDLRDGLLYVGAGGLESGAQRSFVVRVVVPQKTNDLPEELPFKIKVYYRSTVEDQEKELQAEALLTYVDYEASSAQAPNFKLTIALAKSWVAWAVYQLAEFNRQRQYLKGANFGEREVRYMKRLGKSVNEVLNLALVLEQARVSVGQDWGEYSRMEIQASSFQTSFSVPDYRTKRPSEWQTFLPNLSD